MHVCRKPAQVFVTQATRMFLVPHAKCTPYLVRDSLAEGLAVDLAVSPEEMQAVILEVCPAGGAGCQRGVAAASLRC